MTKVWKNILITLCSMFAFLFAGIFFAGCDINYSKIRLTADKQSLSLEVGDSEDVVFTIEGYQDGFSNKVQMNPRSEGQTAIFETSNLVYLSSSQIKVTITGIAGGKGQLHVATLEANKECVIDVEVGQYSKSMQFDNRTLYVSNGTDFVPSADMFVFDANTTRKDLSYYYLNIDDINFNAFSLVDLSLSTSTKLAKFSDGVNDVSGEITKLDRVKLVKTETGNDLVLSLDGVETKVDVAEKFWLLSVYDYSIGNEDYEKILYAVSSVNVLPKIEMSIQGGYNKGASLDEIDVDFEDVEQGNIVIVPNNAQMRQYILKVEMKNSISGTPLLMSKTQSNNHVDIDFLKNYGQEEGKVVYYLKISQNSQTQATTTLDLQVYYDIAQDVEDGNVNITKSFDIEIQIAPTAITVNGTTEPETLTLYNYYRYPEFGWHDLLIDVISGYSSSPNYEGVYFTVRDDKGIYLDMTTGAGVTINFGDDTKLYHDLNTPFKIRGQYGSMQVSDVVLEIHLKSKILAGSEELVLPVKCNIIAGATEIRVAPAYEQNKNDYFYMDLNGDEKDFSNILYANQKFQSISYRFSSGVDVVSFDTHDGDACIRNQEGADARYFLNLSVSPKQTGIGIYTIYLDNGTSLDLNFRVVRTLQTETTEIRLTNDGNEAVTNSHYSKSSDKVTFDDTLNIEILNSSNKDEISFGNVANLTIGANITEEIALEYDKSGCLSVSKLNNIYRIYTTGNGKTKIKFTLLGQDVNETFGKENKKIELYVDVSSYSLVDEFYLKNGQNYALNNTVYYARGGEGRIQDKDKTVVLTPYANNINSQNFYQYYFSKSAFASMFNDARAKSTIDADGTVKTTYSYTLSENQIYSEIVHEKFNRKFIYFYSQLSSGETQITMTEVTITKKVAGMDDETRVVKLTLANGLMFWSEWTADKPCVVVEADEDEETTATYEVYFSNKFSISTWGDFDMESFTYTNRATVDIRLFLKANLRQRNSTKKYDAKITAQPYQSVQNISLATNVAKLNFSNNKLVQNVNAYVFPTSATNKNIRVEFVRTNDNPYSAMVTWNINTIDKDNGVYSIDLSCEKFFEDNRDTIVNINNYLTGRIYIYPSEWGDSYTSIEGQYQPICIEVQYRNGSKSNPYLLESAEDVAGINANDITLRSHYEIGSVIDMSSVKNFVPIGVLQEDGKNVLKGFSGSVIGTNSQAAITNIVVSANNFNVTVDDSNSQYLGLFAQINGGAKIENLSFSGRFDVTMTRRAYTGLVTAVNKGDLINAGAKVSASTITGARQSFLYFGAVSGLNYGKISQDIGKYDGTSYEFLKDEFSDEFVLDENGNKIKIDENGRKLLSTRDFTGQNAKNLAYFTGVVSIDAPSTNVYAGGIAGASCGIVERILPSAESGYKLYGYSGYSAVTMLSASGTSSFTNFKSLYVGGAVGVATASGTVLMGDDTAVESRISNLLVGGEIDTSASIGYDDAVGGIVGYADTGDVTEIKIIKNTSRAFLRAIVNVGGIVGYDYYSTLISTYVDYGTENVIEAVDDGKNNFYSASIIRFLKSDGALGALPTDDQKEVYYAIGNALQNGRSYNNSAFKAYSYVKRTLNTSTESISSNSSSIVDYYGDYIAVVKPSNTYQSNTYQIKASYTFTSKDVELNLGESAFEMKTDALDDDDPAKGIGVYFMYYFAVTGRVNEDGAEAQDEIDALNFVTPNSSLYPFVLGSQDVNITSASSSVLAVDVNGNLTVKGTGLAAITLTSILNVVKSRVIYLYLTNYFDKDVSSSMFYTSSNLNGVKITDGSNLNIYGNSNTNLNVVPSYELSSGKTTSGDIYRISENGVLNYQNVNYNLARNTQITVPSATKTGFVKTKDTTLQAGKKYYVYNAESETYRLLEVGELAEENLSSYYEEGEYFSSVQINKQTIVFYKSKTDVKDGKQDGYRLVPVLQVSIQIGDKKYTYYYEMPNAKIDLTVTYKETATSIRTNFKYHSMQTNNTFEDTATIVSTNSQELLFYQIFDKNGVLVQDRLPEDLSQFDSAESKDTKWLGYINTMDDTNDLFNLQFARVDGQENVFDFTCQILSTSKKFLNRFENNIFGEYTIYLYASELENGVSYSFKILLDEAEINYISLNNYSNIDDVSVPDESVVPSQRGVIEVAVDPVEAVFEKFEISNNALNYQTGRAEASFTFVYETATGYVVAPNFGKLSNGVFSFTYQELIDYYQKLNEETGSEYGYTGKIYISYYMPSNRVEDGVQAGFDVNVTYGNVGQYEMSSTILLKTKLNSYAKLSFNDKKDFGGAYYVARGLSYGMSLNYYGFSEDQISIASTNNFVANVSKVNGNYVLNVTADSINYNNEIGYKVTITTTASKTVDNVVISTTDTIDLYVMEYVMSYVYEDGVNQDIVKGMEDGIIYTAIGNPYTLQFDIRDFMEYDTTNSVVVNEVETFLNSMTNNIAWRVYLNGEESSLVKNKTIRSEYYYIDSYTITPLKIYNAASDIYHFSASANYVMKNGIYEYRSLASGANPIYTEFAFEVHQQSTEDSPIPVETYADLLNMKDGEWYILLKDIILPGSEYAKEHQVDVFSPLSAKIAGLDGNGYKLKMAGTYEFAGATSIGLFESVEEGTILKNVEIVLTSDVVIKTNVQTFNIGLLAASSAGIVTNCEIDSENGATLSVVCSTTASNAYVAGLVSNNSGYITNSRSKINIIANINIAGLIGQNTGIISSCYYADASLNNKTNTTTEFTAGLVVVNSGEIHTSYVSGLMAANVMFYDRAENFIQSNNNVSGFVYSNDGQIDNCYSNIQLRQSGAFASGFVFENSGSISKCFSTSVLESQQTSNYGFARINSIGTTAGKIEECFYLEDDNSDVDENGNKLNNAISYGPNGETIEGVNISIGEINKDENTDIRPIKVTDFNNWEDTFKSFVVAEGRSIKSVWFYNENENDLSNFSGKIFNTGRIELVSPNIIANSKRQLDRVETIVDETTGATYAKYVYIYTSDSATLGSVYNPILINNAESMEDYITQENNSADYNYSYYRLISNVDYSDYIYNSKTYKTKFMGYFEGNFMTVTGVNMVSSDPMASAGLFAELGNSNNIDAVGVVMNFNFKPTTVSFANTNAVGIVAGKLDGGRIFNVNLTLPSNDQVVVVGKNIVGGVVGVATGNYQLQNVYSQYSAKARNNGTTGGNNFNSKLSDYSKYSFAGSIAGVLSGTGYVYDCVTDTAVAVLADKAGLQFGLIDENVTVKKLQVDMQSNMIVNAYSYGGLVVGESKGNLSDVVVNKIAGGDAFVNFKKIPYEPTAVGGVVGVSNSGKIDNVKMYQSINVGNQSASTGVTYVGGVVGLINGGTILSNIVVDANLTGFAYLGGVAGGVTADTTIVRFENVDVTTALFAQGHKLLFVGMGGLAGYVGESTIIQLSSSIVDHTEKNEEGEVKNVMKKNNFAVSIQTMVYVYKGNISVYVGGILGHDMSLLSHIINDTYSSIVGGQTTNKVLDMSSTDGTFSMTGQVVNIAESGQEPEAGYRESEGYEYKTESSTTTIKILEGQKKAAVGCEYYCNVGFTTSAPKNTGIMMYINLHGDPAFAKA